MFYDHERENRILNELVSVVFVTIVAGEERIVEELYVAIDELEGERLNDIAVRLFRFIAIVFEADGDFHKVGINLIRDDDGNSVQDTDPGSIRTNVIRKYKNHQVVLHCRRTPLVNSSVVREVIKANKNSSDHKKASCIERNSDHDSAKKTIFMIFKLNLFRQLINFVLPFITRSNLLILNEICQVPEIYHLALSSFPFLDEHCSPIKFSIRISKQTK